MFPELSDILNDPNGYLDKKCAIRGVLVVRGADSYLVQSLDDWDSRERVAILVPGFIARLLDVAPVWVGGAGIYLDDVEIVGAVRCRDSQLVLEDVDWLKLFRDDEIYEVQFHEEVKKGE